MGELFILLIIIAVLSSFLIFLLFKVKNKLGKEVIYWGSSVYTLSLCYLAVSSLPSNSYFKIIFTSLIGVLPLIGSVYLKYIKKLNYAVIVLILSIIINTLLLYLF